MSTLFFDSSWYVKSLRNPPQFSMHFYKQSCFNGIVGKSLLLIAFGSTAQGFGIKNVAQDIYYYFKKQL